MNTSIGFVEQRRWKRNGQFPMVVINTQLRDLETPTNNEGFNKLVIHKDYEQPRDPKKWPILGVPLVGIDRYS